MNIKLLGLLLQLSLFAGCENPDYIHAKHRHTSYFYFPSDTHTDNIDYQGFHYQKPHTWVFSASSLSDSEKNSGVMLWVDEYEWSPIVHFNMLTNPAGWQADLPRMDAEIIRRTKLRDITISEEVTNYNKFTGHGIHKVGRSGKYRLEYFLFYPDEISRTRLIVILCDSPNKASLREMDEIIHSVSYHPDR